MQAKLLAKKKLDALRIIFIVIVLGVVFNDITVY